MADNVSNDNDFGGPVPWQPDAHGQAALLLVESLIHGLIARSTLTVADAVEIIDIAAEARAEIAADAGRAPAAVRTSSALLEAVSASLRADLPIKE